MIPLAVIGVESVTIRGVLARFSRSSRCAFRLHRPLTLREGLSLATLDAALQKAAGFVGVSVFAANTESHDSP